MKQGKVGSKWSQKTWQNIATKGPSGPYIIKRPSGPQNKDPSESDDTQILCGMSVTTLQTAEKTPTSLKKGGVNVKVSLGEPQEQDP